MSRDPHVTDPGDFDLDGDEEVIVWELEPLDAQTGVGSYALLPVSDAELWGEDEDDADEDDGDEEDDDHEEYEHDLYADVDGPLLRGKHDLYADVDGPLLRGKHDEDCRRVTNEVLAPSRGTRVQCQSDCAFADRA